VSRLTRQLAAAREGNGAMSSRNVTAEEAAAAAEARSVRSACENQVTHAAHSAVDLFNSLTL